MKHDVCQAYGASAQQVLIACGDLARRCSASLDMQLRYEWLGRGVIARATFVLCICPAARPFPQQKVVSNISKLCRGLPDDLGRNSEIALRIAIALRPQHGTDNGVCVLINRASQFIGEPC